MIKMYFYVLYLFLYDTIIVSEDRIVFCGIKEVKSKSTHTYNLPKMSIKYQIIMYLVIVPKNNFYIYIEHRYFLLHQ